MRVRVAVIAAFVAAIASVGTAGGAAQATLPPDSDPFSSITVTRVAGADRFDVAVRIAQATRSHADVVYLASGADFPDALSAGPAVVHEHGALLLVPPSGLTVGIATELASLTPSRIVVVGGLLSVPESILDEVRGILGATFPIARISGADRYEVSRQLAASVFSAGSGYAFTATGAKFPDALSAGPVATRWSAPLVLVKGTAPAADSTTLSLLNGLRTTAIGIAGGPASVSTGIEASLGALASVRRYGGTDRYEVSLALNDDDLWDFDTVYLATGSSFPDALAGGVLAGTRGHPLYVVPPDCVPNRLLDKIASSGTTHVVLLGGSLSLSPAVERLTPC